MGRSWMFITYLGIPSQAYAMERTDAHYLDRPGIHEDRNSAVTTMTFRYLLRCEC